MTRRPFFGSSGAVAPARMDMRTATEPGRAYRDLFDNLGRLGGALLKDYGDTKKKRQEDKGFIKGVQPILNEIGKGDPMLGDVLKAAKERLNDPEIPLSQRKSEAVSMLQTLSFAQNYRDKQSQMSTRERNIRLEEDLGALKKRESELKQAIDQLGFTKQINDFIRSEESEQVYPTTEQTKQKKAQDIAATQKAETDLERSMIDKDISVQTLEQAQIKTAKDVDDLNTQRALENTQSFLQGETDDSVDTVQFDFSEDSDDFYGSVGGLIERGGAFASKYSPIGAPDLFGIFPDVGTIAEENVAKAQAKINSFNFPLRALLTREITGSRTSNFLMDLVNENLFEIGDSSIQAREKANALLGYVALRRNDLINILPTLKANKLTGDIKQVSQDLVGLDRVEKSLKDSLMDFKTKSINTKPIDEDLEIIRKGFGE